MASEDYDYIVIGAGAAGCVLSSKLSEDRTKRVLLLESGGRSLNPLLHVPKGFFFTLKGERHAYKYQTQPLAGSGQAETWVRGKGLGGSTLVNGLMYLRGARPDFDRLEAAGNPGWGWDRVLAAYRAMEDHSLGANDLRGSGGPLGVSVLPEPGAIHRAMLDAGVVSQGWQLVDDMNAGDAERIGLTPSTVKDGRRVSAHSAFLRPNRRRQNLVIHTGTQAERVVFDGSRAVGVQAMRGGRPTTYRARAEVILCAGTIESALLLERSGVGRPDVLDRAGVACRVESTNVGERVIEQRMLMMQVKLGRRAGATEEINTLTKQLAQGVRYMATRQGPVATPSWDVTCQFKSSPDLDRPDVQGIMAPIALDPTSTDYKLADHSGILFCGYPIRPTTTSSVHLGGPSATDPPMIDSHFLEDAADRSATESIARVARELLGSAPLSGLRPEEQFPGPEVQSPADAVDWSRNTGAGIYHAVGSAAMGPADDDVVDPELRVRGVDCLRVADLSVLPFQVSGNSAAPAMAIGWLAAGLVAA